ncbi:hypothetical protein QI30_07235 [Kurthia sp. 3B1D]|uniref:Uncharacterized protein n=1 Tax=Candidatus Kurthia intestinigallinarum TaxID=1562256 RepID=A0A433RVR1_9BACL|nr:MULTISPECIES: hypothetical protein [unclassified Kurthia]RUS57364.1 hypothetical protein QI30_07235 [Kurthia sp. 3B1D]
MKIIAIVYYLILAGYVVDFLLLLFDVTTVGHDLLIPFVLLTFMGIIACCYFIEMFRLKIGITVIVLIISLVLLAEKLTQMILHEAFFIQTFHSDSLIVSMLAVTSKLSIWLFLFAVSYALGFTNSRTIQPLIASFVAVVFYILVVPLVYDSQQFLMNNTTGLLYENVWPVTFVWLGLAFGIDLLLLQIERGMGIIYSKKCTRKILLLFYSLMALIISICALAGLWFTSIIATILIIATTTLLLVKEDAESN